MFSPNFLLNKTTFYVLLRINFKKCDLFNKHFYRDSLNHLLLKDIYSDIFKSNFLNRSFFRSDF